MTSGHADKDRSQLGFEADRFWAHRLGMPPRRPLSQSRERESSRRSRPSSTMGCKEYRLASRDRQFADQGCKPFLETRIQALIEVIHSANGGSVIVHDERENE